MISVAQLDRIVVVGTTGSGKSTLARDLALLTGAVHVELDALYHQPDWQVTPEAEFMARLGAVAGRPRWIADGNYTTRASKVLWPRAQLIVWLDLPLTTVIPRLARRSVRRVREQTELWHGNRETWSSLLGRESILLWAVRTHPRHRRDLPAIFLRSELASTAVVRLTSRVHVARWLEVARADAA